MPAANPVAAAVARFHADPTYLVQIVRETQSALGWIAPATVGEIAFRLSISRTRVESVVQFYSFFYDKPRGAYRLFVSDNVTDQMLGSRFLFARLLERLEVSRGEVSADGLVSVDLTSCTGMCDQGPALLVNNLAVTRLTEQRVDEIVELVRARVPVTQWPAAFFRVDDNIRRAGPLLGPPLGPGRALDAAIALGRQGLLDEMKRSNLRGRGGAGFATGLKWEGCRNAPGAQRYVVCNADEGEPGTFKDRVLLQSHAGRVFEGMAIAGFLVGALRGLLYLRGEYEFLKASLEAELAAMRDARLLGTAIRGAAGFDFDIEIHMGAGAYVCGEESALIESLEGKPGKPRIRPPFPVTSGYLGHPTVVDNVETLCQATEVAIQGGARFAGLGSRTSTGTKILSVSGDCERPGLYEYPFGVTIAHVLDECGARDVAAVQVSGPSGVCLTPDEFSRRIAFEDVPTAGAFMVFGAHRDLFEVARNFAHFFAHESCGFCTPCRVGTSLQRDVMDKIAEGRGSHYEINELMRLYELMRRTSHCGLGQTAGNAVRDAWLKFRPAFERRLQPRDFAPSVDLDAALGAGQKSYRPRRRGRALGSRGVSEMDSIFTIDERPVPFRPGQTILEAAKLAGIYIPHLCHHPEFTPHGSCRLCTIVVNGRTGCACTLKPATGQEVEVDTPELNALRRTLVQMLFVEGNHFCPGCEKSGNCQLQALGYEFEMFTPHFSHFFPNLGVDASHPDVLLDFSRCIQCELCVRASREIDGKDVFALAGRGIAARLIVNSPTGKLGDSALAASDKAAHICPVGAILVKRVGFSEPIGERLYDREPISAEAVSCAIAETRVGR